MYIKIRKRIESIDLVTAIYVQRSERNSKHEKKGERDIYERQELFVLLLRDFVNYTIYFMCQK